MNLAISRILDSWPWYVIRGTGIIAIVLLVTLMISGIGQVTGWTYRFLEPVKAWLVHKWLSYALLAAVAIHALTLLIDHYVSFHIVDLVVPFANLYTNQSTILGMPLTYVAIPAGIIAAYGIVYIVATSLAWINTKKRAWKYSHFVSYGVMGLVFLHDLGAGSDTTSAIVRVALIGLTLLLGAAVVRRTAFRSTKPAET